MTWPFLVDNPGEGVRYLLPAWYFEPLGWGLDPQRFDSAVESGFQAFMLFFSVPLVAWINKGGWGVERGSSFMAQLILSLHVHAVILALLTVAGGTVALLGAEAAPPLARTSVLIISLVYFAVACRTVFGRTWLFTTTRAALSFCIYGPVMFIGLASFALLSQLAR